MQYNRLEYDQYFQDFCRVLYGYQYVKQRSEITDGIIEWLYEHSGGIISVVVSLIHDAQEIAILNGTEMLNMDTLNEAYQKRLTLLHSYIEPDKKRRTVSKTKTSAELPTAAEPKEVNEGVSVATLAAEAKMTGTDIVDLLKQYMPVVEVAV